MARVSSPYALRMSAQETYRGLFKATELSKFVYWLGYVMSGQCASELKMAKALEPICVAKFPTIRRWINGEAKPNGTNMLMLYGDVLSAKYHGNQELLLYDFISFQYPELINAFFIKSTGSNKLIHA